MIHHSRYQLTSQCTALLLGRKCVVNLVFSVKTSIMYKPQDDTKTIRLCLVNQVTFKCVELFLEKNVFLTGGEETFHVVGTDYNFTGVQVSEDSHVNTIHCQPLLGKVCILVCRNF